MKTTVTVRGQTVVPAKIRKDHHITPNTQLEWIDDGETIRIVPLPPIPSVRPEVSHKGFARNY